MILSTPIESQNEDFILQGERVKTTIASSIIDIWTRLEVLLGLKLSDHMKTLAKVSNLIDEIYKGREI